MSASAIPAPLESRRARRSGRSRRQRVALLAAAGLGAVALGAGGVTYALWSDSVVFAGGPITAGDLQLTRGDGSWRQVTPNVSVPAAGSLADGPGDFVSMPGDVLEIVVPVETLLRGDNLQAQMRVEAGTSLSTDMAVDALTASYRVQSADAALSTEEAPLGVAVTVPGLEGSNEGAEAAWDVVVTVNVGGTYAWAPTSTVGPQRWTLDDFVISLDQVRGSEAAAREEVRR